MRILVIASLLSVFMASTTYAQYSGANTPTYPKNSNQNLIELDTLSIKIDSVKGDWDHLTINSDSRINKLLEIKKEESVRKGGLDGYRLQIYQGNRTGADKIRTEFLSKYPDYKAYRTFDAPDWKVRVGDFRNKSEAIKLEHLIDKDFPNSLLIVEDVINYPELISGEK